MLLRFCRGSIARRERIGVACRLWHPQHVRWNENKSQRFQALRMAEAQRPLTAPERAELERLLCDLDADEADALRPATEQTAARVEELTAEKAALEAQADALASIATEQRQMLADANAYLQKLRDRSAAL